MYFSPVRYGFKAMMISQFQDINTDAVNNIMSYYDFEGDSFWVCLGALLALFVSFRLLVIVSLACQDRKRGISENDTRNSNIGKKREQDDE